MKITIYKFPKIYYLYNYRIIFKLSSQRQRNIALFEKLKQNNNEIKESNDKYDIVAKATSDTIWDWKMKMTIFLGIKSKENVLATNKRKEGENSTWWF
jgi:hypothetical protein